MGRSEGKGLMPRLRFPEFRESGAWAKKTIDQISRKVTAGGTPSTSEKAYWGGDLRWMNSGELNLKKVYEVEGRITAKGLSSSSTKMIPKKSVLIGLAGQGKTRGTVAMNMVELCINQSIAAIFPNEECYYSNFLYHNLDKRYDELRSLSTGGEGRGGLNLQIIKSLDVPLPELKEQQKIADCLSSIDDLISTQANKIEALKAHKKGLMQKLFPTEGQTTPELRFPEFRGSGEWQVKSFSKLFKIGSGRDYKHLSDGDIPVYGSGGYMRSVDEYLYDGQSACIGRKGTINKPIFLEGKFWTVDTLFYTHSFKDCLPKFIFLLFQNINWLSFNEAGGVPSLSKVIINKIEVALPPDTRCDEQRRITDCLSSIDKLINASNRKLKTLQAHKKGLMQQLFPSMDEGNT